MKRKLLKGLGIAEIVLKPVLGAISFVFGFIWILAYVFGIAIAAVVVAPAGEEAAHQATENVANSPIITYGYVFFILGVCIIVLGLILSSITFARIKKGASKEQLRAIAIIDIILFNPIVGIALLAVRENEFDIVNEQPAQTEETPVVEAEPVEK